MTSTGVASARGFQKRVYVAGEFFGDLGFIACRSREYLDVVRGRRVSVAFAEKLRLVTSASNQCVLCARLHREWADWAGVEADEIRSLLQNDLRGAKLSDYELAAVLYAQHYAECRGVVDARIKADIASMYGTEIAHDIELILRLINFFNRTLNTVEAFVSRVASRRAAADSNPAFEAFVTLLSAPIAGPLFVYTRVKGNRFVFDRAADPGSEGAPAVSGEVER